MTKLTLNNTFANNYISLLKHFYTQATQNPINSKFSDFCFFGTKWSTDVLFFRIEVWR